MHIGGKYLLLHPNGLTQWLPSPQSKLTFHCDIIHRQLQALASSHHLHSVPLVVIQLLSCQQHLRSFACCGEGVQNQKQHSRDRCAHTTHPSTHPPTSSGSHTASGSVRGENPHVCQTHSHFGFSRDSESGRNRICSLTDCKNWMASQKLAVSRQGRHQKTSGQISRYQLRERIRAGGWRRRSVTDVAWSRAPLSQSMTCLTLMHNVMSVTGRLTADPLKRSPP